MEFFQITFRHFLKYTVFIFGLLIICIKGYYGFEFDIISLSLFIFIVIFLFLTFKEVLDILSQYLDSCSVSKDGISFKIKQKIDEKVKKVSEDIPEMIETPSDASKDYFMADPILLFANLRIEIERRIDKLLHKNQINTSPGMMSVGKKIQMLRKEGVLPQEIYSLLNDIIPVCNGAVHGKNITRDTAEWGQKISVQILALLDTLLLKE